MGARHSIVQVIFDLRIKARELKRQSDRCYRESCHERLKVRRALVKENEEGARIFAQNVIRKKQEALHCLHLSAKLDAVASRLDAAHRSHQLTSRIHSVASGLSCALRKLDGTASFREMELFSKLFDDLDVRSDSVSSLLESSTFSAMPAHQVDLVVKQVAEDFSIPLVPTPDATEAIADYVEIQTQVNSSAHAHTDANTRVHQDAQATFTHQLKKDHALHEHTQQEKKVCRGQALREIAPTIKSEL